MKMKLTTLLFGLLLAVGWTSSAQAQALPQGGAKAFTAKFDFSAPASAIAQKQNEHPTEAVPMDMAKGPRLGAPRRAAQFDEVSSAVHPKAWYDQYSYTYNDGTSEKTALFTEPATNPYQMMALTSLIYKEPVFPGIKYSKPKNADLTYPRINFGWGITGDHFPDITISTSGSQLNIRSIKITDQNGNTLVNWSASDNYYNGTWVNLPEGWTASHNDDNTTTGATRLRRGTTNGPNSYVYGYLAGGGEITIPGSDFNGKGYTELNFAIVARGSQNTNSQNANGYHTLRINGSGWTFPASSWYSPSSTIYPGVTPPEENGYTVMIVKLKDEVDYENTQAPEHTHSATDLYNYFNTYIDEMQLLTDGLRVGQNVNGELVDGGTLFSYSGTLNRFYFIGKGKMATIGAEEVLNSSGEYNADRAPFYCMYEEFSPTEQDNTTGIDDFYAKMVAGESYHIKHDCQSVNYMEHFFSMSGKSGTDPKSVSNLVFYIPDYRGTDSTGVAWRNYDINNQPRVGLYTIRLQANAQRAADYNEENPEYTVTVTWTSNLASIVDNQIPQTYELYEVVYDENGNIVERTLLTTTQDITSYTYNVPQRLESYTITYQVKGYPTNATNKDTFFAWSNFDDVVIPGLFDFLLLARDHYESDYVISQTKNYYRNYIYPTNLAPNTGMTIEQLKQEWPEDQIAKYTLYRDNTGIAQLWVRALGNKVYYKITYIPNTQDTTGPNNININNSNN